MSERGPSAEEWQAMFDVLSADLLNLEQIANDPETDPEVAEMARAQMEEARPTLHDMKVSRGFIAGGTSKRKVVKL